MGHELNFINNLISDDSFNLLEIKKELGTNY